MSGIRRRAIHKRLVDERNRAVGQVAYLEGLLDVSQLATKTALAERDAVQAKLDSVMLEYCSDEMTDEQRTRWAAAQEPVPVREFTPEEIAAVDETIERQIQTGT